MIPEHTSVWLYGSVARGDTDENSDVDVLVVADNRVDQTELITELAGVGLRRPSLSRYTWTEMEGMKASGSLFLHHLKAEGRALLEGSSVRGRLRSYLDSLPPYTRAGHDVKAFKTGLQEARDSLRCGGSVPFELSVIATLIRHSSILACYVMGKPTFGRTSPVDLVASKWGLGRRLVEDFEGLYAYKLSAEQRVKTIEIQDTAYALKWCDRLEGMLSRLEVAVDQYIGNLPTTASFG